MKKGFIALAVVAMASSVFAQEAPKAEKAAKVFTLSGGVDAYYLSAQTIGDKKGYQHADYGTARSRPKFTVADGSSEFNLEFEMIGNYGVQDASIGGSNGAPIGNDQTGSMKLRGMYFSSTVAGIDGLKLTGGLCPTLDLGMWEKDLSPGFTAAYSVGKLATVSLAYFQVYESDKAGWNGDSSDAQYYSATALVKPIDGLSINFMGAYEIAGKKTATGTKGLVGNKKMADGTGMMGGAWVKGTFGQIGISGIFQYASNDGKVAGTTTKYKGSAYAANISPTFDIDKNTTVAVFATYVTGDDPSTTNKDESWWNATLDAQGFGHKMILFEDCGVCSNLDATNASQARVRAKGLGQTYGYALAGAWATTKIGIYNPTFAVAYGQLAEKLAGMKKDLGIEFDLFNAFKISDATTLNIEFAYLLTGDAYKSWDVSTKSGGSIDTTNSQKVQNAYSIAAGMTQKF